MTRVYIIFYSKNKHDDVCDSSILECYSDLDFATEELKRIRLQNEGDEYTYYLGDFYVNEGKVIIN